MVSRHCSNLRLRLRSLGLDKYIEYPVDDVWPELKLEQGHFERVLMQLFMIDVVNLITTKVSLSKNFRIQPSEIDRMPYWEYEIFLMKLNEQVKEENDKQKAEMDKYDIDGMKKRTDPKYMSKQTSSMMPKMPSFGSMQTPSFKF